MSWQTVLKWRWIRALQIWNYVPIRAQGGVITLLPIAALVVSFIFAIYGNSRRTALGEDIQRRFKLVRQYNDLQSLMINAETGERGYLLTKKTEYLEPYQKAITDIPPTIESLRQTINDELGDKPRTERLESLAQVESLINQQLDSLKVSQSFAGQNKNADELSAQLENGKVLMDKIRGALDEMQERDGELLNERVNDINYIRRRDYIFVFLALCAGIIARLVSFYLFDRGIVRRIDRMRENVELIGAGEKIKFQPTKKNDAVGLLEEEIAKIAEKRNLSNNSDK